MAIYGAGSIWDGKVEMKDQFFSNSNFVIGWDYIDAKDLYTAVTALRVGDIIYLKSSASGSRSINVKGIGIVTHSFIDYLIDSHTPTTAISSRNGFAIKVKWTIIDSFNVTIPATEGKLTNVRAATFYEENLPFVQKAIIEKFIGQTI